MADCWRRGRAIRVAGVPTEDKSHERAGATFGAEVWGVAGDGAEYDEYDRRGAVHFDSGAVERDEWAAGDGGVVCGAGDRVVGWDGVGGVVGGDAGVGRELCIFEGGV